MTIPKNKEGKFKKINDFSNIENDKYVIKWLDGIKSKQARISLMNDFCNFLEKTPSELAQEHQEDLKLDVLNRSNIAKIQLNNFFGYLTNTNDKFVEGTVFAYREVLQRMGYKYAALLELETFVCEEIERLRKEDSK